MKKVNEKRCKWRLRRLLHCVLQCQAACELAHQTWLKEQDNKDNKRLAVLRNKCEIGLVQIVRWNFTKSEKPTLPPPSSYNMKKCAREMAVSMRKKTTKTSAGAGRKREKKKRKWKSSQRPTAKNTGDLRHSKSRSSRPRIPTNYESHIIAPP